jgi:hypothetical protein
VLPVLGAIVASALSGIALGRAVEVDRGPSSLTRSGLTIQLPAGWEQVRFSRGESAFSPGIAVGPPGESRSGLVAGKTGSQAAAERMLEGAQTQDGGRTQVWLGNLDAWRYAGLQPRPHLVGTGYLVPTAGGAVVVICHTHEDNRAFLAECDRVGSTLVVSGEGVRPRSLADGSGEHLAQVIATLRSSRSEALGRLGAADLAAGQVRAATSLQRGHQRAAQSVDRISPLANGRSLPQLSAALRAASAAYGRLAAAAKESSGTSYREASQAVAREEDALRRELARATGA